MPKQVVRSLLTDVMLSKWQGIYSGCHIEYNETFLAQDIFLSQLIFLFYI